MAQTSEISYDVIQNILWSWADSGIKGTFVEAETYVNSIHTGNWHRTLPFLEGDIVRLMRTIGVLELNPSDTMWSLISRAIGGPQNMTMTKHDLFEQVKTVSLDRRPYSNHLARVFFPKPAPATKVAASSSAVLGFNRTNTGHKHIVLDLKYDFYGKLLATCSADHTIRIWKKDQKDEWKLTQKAIECQCSVRKLSWAHPMFGQILACCFGKAIAFYANKGTKERPQWTKKADVKDSHSEVMWIEFAPKHLGLQLAIASGAEVLCIQTHDLVRLKSWQIKERFRAPADVLCLSWNPTRYDDNKLLAVGTSKNAYVYEFDPQRRQWRQAILLKHDAPVIDIQWAPCPGRESHWIATASGHLVRIFEFTRPKFSSAPLTKTEVRQFRPIAFKSKVCRIEWDPLGAGFATSRWADSIQEQISVWKLNEDRQWSSKYSIRIAQTPDSPASSSVWDRF